MSGDAAYDTLLAFGLAFSIFTALAALAVATPYGRFATTSWGPNVPVRLGWLLMESPTIVSFVAFLALQPHATSPLALAVVLIWVVHYTNRWLVFPLLMRPQPGGTMALVVPLTGAPVTVLHAWFYAAWVGRLAPDVSWDRVLHPAFVIGAFLWALGFGLIVHSEHVLRSLRRAGGTGYSLPRAGAFRWVSSPHYLGELLAWLGLMIAAGAPGGLFMLSLTAANLVPRASATHSWYREHFPDYPPERKALLPFLW